MIFPARNLQLSPAPGVSRRPPEGPGAPELSLFRLRVLQLVQSTTNGEVLAALATLKGQGFLQTCHGIPSGKLT